jgi:hypothetical protein
MDMREALNERKKRREAARIPGFKTTRQKARDWKGKRTNGTDEKVSDIIREADINEDMRRRSYDPRFCADCGADKGNKQYPCPRCDN